MRRRGPHALVASPVLVGAVTVLVAMIAVLIAYNAHSGLPFVPTYDLRVELANASKLGRGSEVRAGGFRVGAVDRIRSARRVVGGEERSIAVLDVRLDKTVEPLPVDTAVTVRSRSALGLKFVELTPGRAERSLDAGDTIPLRNVRLTAGEPEDFTAVFDDRTRVGARAALEGFGTALAGRGPALNQTIEELAPLLRHLEPVMRNLSDPRTELAGFFPRLGRALGELSPVARVQGELFANQAATFAALGRDPDALRATIEEGPSTLSVSIRSLRVQTPFLARFAEVSRRLRPAARELRISLPAINSALAVGTPVLLRFPELSEDLERLAGALERLGDNPSTLLALRDLRQALRVARPLAEFVAPYQTVCNYFVYFWAANGGHLSQTTRAPDGHALGTVQRVLSIPPSAQRNSLTTSASSRPVDVPPGTDPQAPDAGQALHSQQGGPAVDTRGRADCQTGQWGYLDRLATDDRYGPNRLGGAHIVVDPDTPGRAGGTWVSRRLGLDHVEDVP
jgi:virulence factor Mce-like protein